jgi:hypothetical protein
MWKKRSVNRILTKARSSTRTHYNLTTPHITPISKANKISLQSKSFLKKRKDSILNTNFNMDVTNHVHSIHSSHSFDPGTNITHTNITCKTFQSKIPQFQFLTDVYTIGFLA